MIKLATEFDVKYKDTSKWKKKYNIEMYQNVLIIPCKLNRYMI